MSYTECQSLIDEFASEKDEIKDSKFLNLVNSIENITEENEPKNIDKLFFSTNERWTPEEILDIKEKIANEYAMSYTKELAKTEIMLKQNNNIENYIDNESKNIEIVRLKENFNFFVHSTDAQFVNTVETEEKTNFQNRWHQGKDKSNHIISMSYINQDFVGCAPVGKNGVLYGFTNLEKEKIKLMGSTDINSYSRNFSYNSKTKKYLSAKTMPYNSRRVYNEIGVERNDTEPNCVILFDDANEEVKKNSYLAASQNGIPLVLLDKEEIKNSQIKRL
jgi:hypothetical protein